MNATGYSSGLDKAAANYVALSPLSFIRRAAAVYPDRIAVVRLTELDLRRPLFMVHDERRALPQVAAAFTSWVRSLGEAAAPAVPADGG